ncbi:hypothetical protein Q1695_000330 [Nippostrongylus brasiliensis]|nr:hypothetical protein Q1695_000330 [Nippostrongylus brasiliensis]
MELNNEGYQETEGKRSIFSSAVDAAMLSLLSLIIASGTVLRADTEQWEPTTYPDPRTNATGCNTVDNSTLCDPDRILTDTWRQTINENINRQTARLRNIDIHYTDEAPENCTLKNGSDVQIFTEFGHKLRKAFGLDSQTCKDYIMILGVELAKELYVWTGSDLLFPKDRLDTSLNQYKNMFLEKNYMEGLNKIVEEIGNILVDPFEDSSTTASTNNATLDANTEENTQNTTTLSQYNTSTPIWIYIIMIISVLTALISMTFLFAVLWKKYEIRIMFPYPTKKNDSTHGDGDDVESTSKPEPDVSEEETPQFHRSKEEEETDERSSTNDSNRSSPSVDRRRCSVSEISLPRTVSLTGSNRLAYLQSADAYRLKKFDPQFQPPTSSGSLV